MLDARLVVIPLAIGLLADPAPRPAAPPSLAAPAPAPIGAPLICFPLDIGEAASLPFAAEGHEATTKMTPDEIAVNLRSLLAKSDDVVVHMETLRRVAIWLMSLQSEGRGPTDPQRQNAAKIQALLTDDLLVAAAESGTTASASATPRAEALRWFDLGYFVAAGGQAGFGERGRSSVWLEKAARLEPNDLALQFGIALAEFDHKSDGSGANWARHLTRVFDESKESKEPKDAKEPKAVGAAAATATVARPTDAARLRKNVLATFGTFLGQRDWEKLGAEVRKQSGRA